ASNSTRGAATCQLPSPAGIRMATKKQLMKVASGPTEISMPPERMDGVEANPTSTNGARVESVAGSRCGDKKDGEIRRFSTSKTSASRRAKAKGQRWRSCWTRLMSAHLISGRSRPRQLIRLIARDGRFRQILADRGRLKL